MARAITRYAEFWPYYLREHAKAQTRALIADTAWRLFADRGFDRVTVAEVAREAMVAPATVFNYFPTKEDLFFSRLEAFGASLLAAIEDRPPGQPVLEAFRRFLLQPTGLLSQLDAGDPQALERLRTVNRMIAASPALQARERRALANYADSLAALLAKETGATVVSTALAEMRRIVAERYPVDEWNIYAAQASDGDNYGNDSELCDQILQEDLLPLCQYFAYVEVVDEREAGMFRSEANASSLWRAYKLVADVNRNFAMKRVFSKADIFPVFHQLFSKARKVA